MRLLERLAAGDPIWTGSVTLAIVMALVFWSAIIHPAVAEDNGNAIRSVRTGGPQVDLDELCRGDQAANDSTVTDMR